MTYSVTNQSTPPEPLDFFARLAQTLRPDIRTSSGAERMAKVVDVTGTLLTLPLALIGLGWLLAASDWPRLSQHWALLLLVVVLIVLLDRWIIFMVTDLGTPGGGAYGNANSSLDSVIRWSALFLIGPTVLWVFILVDTVLTVIRARKLNWTQQLDLCWNTLRGYVFSLTSTTLLALISLSIYRALGGTYPISGLSVRNFFIGAAVIGTELLLGNLLLWTTYLGYSLWKMRAGLTPRFLFSILGIYAFSLAIPTFANLFAAPLAGIFLQHGFFLFLIFCLGLLAIAWLANRMSQASEHSRGQTAQIEKLEALGRAILNAPPDNSTLPDLLHQYAPAMYTFSRLAIWLETGQMLLKQSERWEAKELDGVRPWLAEHRQAQAVHPKDRLPWQAEGGTAQHRPTLVAPILEVESGGLLGGIYLELATFGQTHTRQSLDRMLPTVQSLAAQVAAAQHQAVIYERMLAQQKTQNELEFARRIQTSFLPAELPQAAGWQLCASLDPAREMSGDFYDVIALPAGKIGLLVADVADKGVGPALFMALSRTLIRTFAAQFADAPEQVLQAANERILQDAGDNMFVTTFYGVLDPESGALVYANAGHNPPLLLRAAAPHAVEFLGRTGTVLGMMEDLAWQAKSVFLECGDVLVLYTDGVTDAQNAENVTFGEKRLVAAVREQAGLAAPEIHGAILDSIRAFVGEAPQFDDITLLTLKRAGHQAESSESIS